MSSYFKQILVTAIGTLGSQLLIFGYMPFMTKYFEPSLIGEYNFVFSLATIIGTVLCFRAELAILVDDKAVAVKGFWFATLVSVFLLVPVVFLLSFYYSVVNAFFIGIFVLGFWLMQALANLMNVNRQYFILALSKVMISLVFILLGVCYIKFEVNFGTLFHFHAFAYVLVSLLLLIFVFGKYRFGDIKAKDFKYFYEESKRFVCYIFPATLLNQFSRLSLPLLIPVWYGNYQAGLYAVASKLVMFPLTLLGYSVGMVYRREAIANVSQQGNCTSVFSKTVQYLFPLMIVYIFGVLFLFEPLYKWFFSRTWDEVVTYCIILLPYCAVGILYGPLSQSFLVARQQRLDFIFQSAMFITVFVVFAAGYYFELDFSLTLILFSVSGALIQLLGLYVCYRIVKHPSKTISPAVT